MQFRAETALETSCSKIWASRDGNFAKGRAICEVAIVLRAYDFLDRAVAFVQEVLGCAGPLACKSTGIFHRDHDFDSFAQWSSERAVPLDDVQLLRVWRSEWIQHGYFVRLQANRIHDQHVTLIMADGLSVP